MTRPRESVLALFDPLHNPKATSLHLADINEPLVEVDEDAEEQPENFIIPETPSMIVPLAYSPRTPLREIPLDDIHHYSTPLVHKQQPNRRPPAETIISPPPVKKVGAPRESTFTRIINEIEANGLPFGSQPPPPPIPLEYEPPKTEPREPVAPPTPPVDRQTTEASPYYPPGFLDDFYKAIQIPDYSFGPYEFDLSVDPEILEAAEKYQGGGIVYTEDNKPIPPCAKFGWGTPVALIKQQKALAASLSSAEECSKRSATDEQCPEKLPLPSTPPPKHEGPDSLQEKDYCHTPLLSSKLTPAHLPADPQTNEGSSVDTPPPQNPLAAAMPPTSEGLFTPQEMVTPAHRANSLAAPPPVHALRIVKRIKRGNAAEPLHRAISTGLATRTTRSEHVSTKSQEPTLKTNPTRPATTRPATLMVTKAPHKPGAPITTGDGPKRVLITDPAAPAQQNKSKAMLTRPALGSTRAATAPSSSLPRANFTTSGSKLPVAGRVASGPNRVTRRGGQ